MLRGGEEGGREEGGGRGGARYMLMRSGLCLKKTMQKQRNEMRCSKTALCKEKLELLKKLDCTVGFLLNVLG